ncbi:MAG: alpha/beta hydrolase [Rariglobus sp.]|jgi:acetyl esterase/lipase|nr:alpha/beta hydrolase [Rariglobus sp.]
MPRLISPILGLVLAFISQALAEPGPITERLDIPYREITNADNYAAQRCKLDVYLPAAPAANFPILVWFHGGGLSGGDKAAGPEQAAARRLAGRGIAVVAANYRLSPQVKFPVYLEDAAAAVRWTASHASGFGADPKKIYIGGYSAGGYVSAMLALDARYLHDAGVAGTAAGFICMSGQMTTHFTVRGETSLPKDTVIVNDAAPLAHVRAGAPRILLLIGDKDWPARLEENQFLAAALHRVAKNPPVPFVIVKDRNHGTILSRFLENGDPAGTAVLDFIAR